MGEAAGESEFADLRLGFDHRLMLEFPGSSVTSDAGLLAFRELDEALGLTTRAGEVLADSRTGRGPAVRWVVGGRAAEKQAASTSQMGRFETAILMPELRAEMRRDTANGRSRRDLSGESRRRA